MLGSRADRRGKTEGNDGDRSGGRSVVPEPRVAALDGPLELHDGEPREKPATSVEHGGIMMEQALSLGTQLKRDEYEFRINHAKLM